MSEYDYGYGEDKVYCYPGTSVLINKLDLRDPDALLVAERAFSSTRLLDARRNHFIDGAFDLAHLQAIHFFLFQDIYPWAGQLRKIDISKGHMFCRPDFIVPASEELFAELKKEDYLRQVSDEDVPIRLSYYLAGINAIHPFREGNGRAQRLFIEYLAEQRNFMLDFASVSDREMIVASSESFEGKMEKMDILFKRIARKRTVK
jgi:cell filamentation protein